jgi:hypothetical protein
MNNNIGFCKLKDTECQTEPLLMMISISVSILKKVCRSVASKQHEKVIFLVRPAGGDTLFLGFF